MKHLLLALAITAAAGCSADRTPADGAATQPPAAETATPPSPAQPTTPTPEPQAPPAPDTTATVPAQFQGNWALDAAACAVAGHESRLGITADRIQFHESSGAVTSVMTSGSDLTVVANVTGEGETREATYRFRLSADGTTLTDMGSGTGMVRHRC